MARRADLFLNRLSTLLVGAVAVVLVGCADHSDKTYVTAEVALGDVRDVVPAVGTVEPVSQIEVRADAPGRVLVVLVQPNSRVIAGQVLARIQPDRLNLDVEAAEASRNAAQAVVSEMRARSDQARQNLANRRTLSEAGFISRAALNDAEAQARAAQASLSRSEADAARAAVQVRAARALLSDVLVRAPSDGFVLSREVEPGQVVAPASEKPLFVIVSDTSKVVVEALVAEPDISRVTADARIVFTVEAYPGERFVGRLKDVLREPRRDRNFVSYPVRIEADNLDGRLFPGMTASVEFIHADARRVLRIPIEAIYFTPEGYVPTLPPDLAAKLKRRGLTQAPALDGAEVGRLYAQGFHRTFVITPRGPQMRPVRIGAQSAEYLEVREGLKAGDLVMVRNRPPGSGSG